jgi:hypothetical protein
MIENPNQSDTLQSSHAKLNVLPITKEDTMPEANISDVGSSVQSLHALEPIMERKTHIFGWVKVYPPNADPSEWSSLSWKLTTEHGSDKTTSGLCEILRADTIFRAWDRPHFITDFMRFGYEGKIPSIEPKAKKPKKKPDTYKRKDVEDPFFD